VRGLVIGRHKHVLYVAVKKGSLPVNGAILDWTERVNGLVICTTRARAPTPMITHFLFMFSSKENGEAPGHTSGLEVCMNGTAPDVDLQ
jgi:hypothetical protein